MKRVCIVILILLALFAAPVSAQDQNRARNLVNKKAILPLSRILPAVKKHCKGKVLDVRLTNNRGRHYYSVKILDKRGTLRNLTVDAKSGRIRGKC